MKSNQFLRMFLLAAFTHMPWAGAAVLGTVPMGGPMVHVTISYSAGQNTLTARVDPMPTQLTPFDVTNPNDNFAPGDPWFSCLDPSACGLAFNRQYGLVVDALTDPLPLNTGIWIRCLSATPGLGFYYYRSTEPKNWAPMFGTLGSTNVWPWSLAMFHPAVTAPAVNCTHSANFEAFAVDLITGLQVSSIAPAGFTLTWSDVASGRPTLQLGPDLVLAWPGAATNYVLEASSSPMSGNWQVVTNTPILNSGRYTLPLGSTNPAQFYRLRRQ